MGEQRIDATRVQLGEPMSFNGVTHRNMGEGFLRELKDSCIPKAYSSMCDSSPKLGAWSTLTA